MDARADLYHFGSVLYALELGHELSELDFDGPGEPKPVLARHVQWMLAPNDASVGQTNVVRLVARRGTRQAPPNTHLSRGTGPR